MEELVGRWWHQAITKATRLDHPAAAVQLQDMQKAIGILFRAAGGAAALRFTPASQQAVGGQRHWLQKLAGSGQRADTAQLEPDVLALPATLAVFDDAQLNRDLYLWLAMLSACFVHSGDWIRDNLRATQAALAAVSGFCRTIPGAAAGTPGATPEPEPAGRGTGAGRVCRSVPL